mmetsp:Transcript_9466/g.16986  ORF Transcript_9466/g.16986 Transcript_9466/m.16986 type:complete len:210 (-) Transcript_9466:426-1055(-)
MQVLTKFVPAREFIEQLGFQCSCLGSTFCSFLLFGGLCRGGFLRSLLFGGRLRFVLEPLLLQPRSGSSLVLAWQGHWSLDRGRYHTRITLFGRKDVGYLALVKRRVAVRGRIILLRSGPSWNFHLVSAAATIIAKSAAATSAIIVSSTSASKCMAVSVLPNPNGCHHLAVQTSHHLPAHFFRYFSDSAPQLAHNPRHPAQLQRSVNSAP